MNDVDVSHARKGIQALLAVILVCEIPLSIGNGNMMEFSFPKVNVLERDLFIIALSPPVEDVQAYVHPIGGKAFSLLVITNGSLGAPIFEGRVSMVQLVPGPPLTNITVTFNSNSTVNMIYGVLTNNYSYYEQVSSESYRFSNGIFVVLQPQATMPPGASKITFILNVFSIQTKDDFYIDIPPLAKALPPLVAILLLVYLNAYIVVDSYYISIREELSTMRKLAIVLSIAISAFLVYWLMSSIVKF